MFEPVGKLEEFLRHPSVSTDAGFRDGMAGAQEFLVKLLTSINFTVELVETELHPVILARRDGNGAWPKIVFYGHYDVQPADPLELWATPPFEPMIVGKRIYGRGASDNKGPLLTNIAAVACALEEDPLLPVRITFLIEGEEEIGSPSFPQFLASHREELADADFVYLSDTWLPSPDRPAVTCGLRGLAHFELRMTGAKRNPIQGLAEILASLHLADGRVNAPGFYADVLPIPDWERAELKKLGTDLGKYQEFLGVEAFHVPSGWSPFEAICFQPTLEFNGIGGGELGAYVKISCRLVPDQQPEKIKRLLTAALEARSHPQDRLVFHDQQAGDAYVVVPPNRANSPPDLKPGLSRGFAAIEKAIGETWGCAPLYLREGGSVPIVGALKRAVGLDSIMFGLSLAEDNLHAPNESYDLEVMMRGLQTTRHFLKNFVN